MPKVTTERHSINGIHFFGELKVNTKGIFSLSYPAGVSEFLDKEEERGEVRNEVFKAWKDNLEKYAKAQTSKRKVIFFKAEITARIYTMKGKSGSSDRK